MSLLWSLCLWFEQWHAQFPNALKLYRLIRAPNTTNFKAFFYRSSSVHVYIAKGKANEDKKNRVTHRMWNGSVKEHHHIVQNSNKKNHSFFVAARNKKLSSLFIAFERISCERISFTTILQEGITLCQARRKVLALFCYILLPNPNIERFFSLFHPPLVRDSFLSRMKRYIPCQ